MATTKFPEFLRPAFDESSLDELPSSICVLDPTTRILWVNRAWRRFASEHGPGDDAKWTTYLDGVAPPLREHYQKVFDDALASGKPYEQEYECSSPERRRHFHLRALPIDRHGLVVEHALVAEHRAPHADGRPVDDHYRGEGGQIAQCSNCRRVRHPSSGAFHWVPLWVQSPHPATSHIICPTCASYYFRRRGAPR